MGGFLIVVAIIIVIGIPVVGFLVGEKCKDKIINGSKERNCINALGWVCTNCGRHHSMFVGKCRCGEVFVGPSGDT